MAESYGRSPCNVIIHEFAHVLDFAGGAAEGLQHEYDRFEQALQQEEPPERYARFDAYTAYNAAEFFAVSSERFFQCPGWLHEQLPALFGLLQRYYGTDPRRWGIEAEEACD